MEDRGGAWDCRARLPLILDMEQGKHLDHLVPADLARAQLMSRMGTFPSDGGQDVIGTVDRTM